jgi:hypothetical protein
MLAYSCSWRWSLGIVAGRKSFLGVALRSASRVVCVSHFKGISFLFLSLSWLVGWLQDNEGRWVLPILFACGGAT